MRDWLGGQDVNWLAFGAHASNTAGFAIRRERVPLRGLYGRLQRGAENSGFARLVGRILTGSFVARYTDDVQRRMAEALSDGNLRIFAEMAPVVVRFLDLVAGDAVRDDDKLEAFLHTLKPGASEQGGQEMLGRALSAWYRAAHTEDPRTRSQLVLLGNARMGWHEQTRVQPDIEEALGAPLRGRLGDELTLALRRRVSGLPGFIRRPLLGVARAMEPALLNSAALTIKQGATRHMMRYATPQEDVPLGHDLAPRAGVALYPPHLQKLDDPELCALLAELGSTDGDTSGRGASDWADFRQRMGFIVALFRSRQCDTSLFATPRPLAPTEHVS